MRKKIKSLNDDFYKKVINFFSQYGLTYVYVKSSYPPIDENLPKKLGQNCKNPKTLRCSYDPHRKDFIVRGKKAIVAPHKFFYDVCLSIGETIESLVEKGILIKCDIKDVYCKKCADLLSHLREVPKTSKWMQAARKELCKKSTRYESAVFRALPRELKSEAVCQYPIEEKKYKYFLDIYLRDHFVCIEVDGGYHNDPERAEKDKLRDERLLSLGIKTYRITNEDVCNRDKLKAFIATVSQACNY